MFRSIQWRIGLSYLVLIVFSMAALAGYLLSYTWDSHISSLEPQLISQARLVADVILRELSEPEQADANALVRELAQQTNLRITLFDRNGVIVADSLGGTTSIEGREQMPEVMQALKFGTGESVPPSAVSGIASESEVIYAAVAIQSQRGPIGVVRVAMPLSDLDRSLKVEVRKVALAISGAAGLAILLALLLTRITTRPLRRLTQMAMELAAGDLDGRVRLMSRDEIGQLAQAFNQMGERLKRMIEAVSQERNRLAAILSGMADGIIIIDDEGNVALLNKAGARLLGLRSDVSRYIGHSLIEVVRNHELVRLAQDCIRDSGGTQSEQARLIEIGESHPGSSFAEPQRSAAKRYLRAVATPIREEGRRRALIILHDITELRRAETVRREFIANVSHELRTPLASLKALVETLQDGALEDEAAAQEFLRRMQVEVDGLTQLVRELLELSRIESGQMVLRLEPTDVRKLLEASRDRLLAQAQRAGVELALDVPTDISNVLADEERVQQVLINLIHNAIKFTPAGGRVTLNATVSGDGVLISVADTGVGIPADDLPRIFERFYKADKSRSSGGTGLGLAVAKHIVQAHGGEIWAESVEGQGARLTFRLPVAMRERGDF